MREHYLGFLLEALDPGDHQQVARHVAGDPQARQDVERLRRALEPLEADREHHQPPAGLAARTVAHIARHAAIARQVEPRTAVGSWQWQELSVAAGVFCVAALLFFPAVNHSRAEARITRCQNNLRAIGLALVSYSQNHGGYFPFVAPQGNLAVAGIYGPLLCEAGLLDDARQLACPEKAARAEARAALPSTRAMLEARQEELPRLQARCGGAYGYTFGYVAGDRYHGTKNRQRANFALAGDAPDPKHRDAHSGNHRGQGQNVLFEDGHVRFVHSSRLPGSGDDIFHNDHGKIAAGLHVNDAVIATSCASPHVPLVYVSAGDAE